MSKSERYYSLKSKGICTRCGKEKATNGRTYCDACKKKLSDRRKQRIEEFGMCPTCNRKLIGDERQCLECLTKIRNKRKPSKANYEKAKMQSIRYEAEHRCKHCGRKLPIDYTKKNCQICIGKRAEKLRINSNHVPKAILYSYTYPYCVRCKKNERLIGYKVCAECRDKMQIARNKRTDKQEIKGLFIVRKNENGKRTNS